MKKVRNISLLLRPGFIVSLSLQAFVFCVGHTQVLALRNQYAKLSYKQIKTCIKTALLISFCSLSQAYAREAIFENARFYVLGGAGSVEVADFNLDGKLDAVITGGGDISILLGDGNGTLSKVNSYYVGSSISKGVAVGDFNLDGRPDVANANIEPDTATVSLGFGDGTMGLPSYTVSTGSWPWQTGVADFNLDRKPDLAVLLNGVTSVNMYLGNGNGKFTWGGTYGVGLYTKPVDIAIGDLNKDGIPDIVTANSGDGTISVLFGLAGGKLETPFHYTAVDQPFGVNQLSGVAVGDLNLDGNLDVVTANSNYQSVSVLLGDSNGSGFLRPAVSYTVSAGAIKLAIQDVNMDSKPDVITNTHDGVSVLLGYGNGTLHSEDCCYVIPATTYDIAIGDFNSDKKPDIIVAISDINFEKSIALLLNNYTATDSSASVMKVDIKSLMIVLALAMLYNINM